MFADNVLCLKAGFLPLMTPANVSINIKIELQSSGGMILPLVPVFNVLKSYGCLNIIDHLSGTALIHYNLWESETSCDRHPFKSVMFFLLNS